MAIILVVLVTQQGISTWGLKHASHVAEQARRNQLVPNVEGRGDTIWKSAVLNAVGMGTSHAPLVKGEALE